MYSNKGLKINIRNVMINSYDNLDNLLRCIHLSPFGDYSELPKKQKQVLNTISQMIQNNEYICEENIKMKLSKEDIDFRSCFWGLYHRKVLVTNNSHQ